MAVEMTRVRRGVLLCLAIALVGGARRAHAQVTISLAGGPVSFASPTGVDFAAGSVTDPTVVTFTVNVTGGAATQRTSLVYVRAASATLGGGKALADLQWSSANNPGVWTSVTTTNVLIETRQIKKNGINDPWSEQVTFRMQLHWATDAPATYGVGLVFTLTVTTP
jgi:hypothetical protein